MPTIRLCVERAGRRVRSRLLLSALMSGMLLAFGHGAHADEADAFNFFIGTNATHDDNVFRLSPESQVEVIPGSTERSDVIRTTYAGGKFKKTLGRQLLWLDVNLNQNRYDRFSFLDFDGSSGAGGLDWRLTNLLGGRVGKTRSRQMAGFADLRRTVQNLYTNESEYGSLDLWFQANWHFETELRRSMQRYDAVANQASNSEVDQWKVGVRYAPRDDYYILLRAIQSDGRMPNREVQANVKIDNSYRQSEIGIEFARLMTGQSQLRGALAQTRREHDNVPERNFSGLTGNLGWDWLLTGKTQLSSQLRREIGASNDLQASYILTEGASLTLSWQPTAKIATSLRLDKSFRDYAGDPFAQLIGFEKRKDRLSTLTFSANYRPITSVTLGFNVARMERISNFPGLAFTANTATLDAQFAF